MAKGKNEDQAQKALRGDPDNTEGGTERESQEIRRMPADLDVGPHFPSGMSAPEAAMAGATAGMSDEDQKKIREQAKRSGMTDAALVAAGSDDDDDE